MPGLAFSYDGGHPDMAAHVLPLVDYLEVSPDALTDASGSDLRLHEPSLRELLSYQPDVQYLVHGVGLSLASPEGYSRRYVEVLDQCLLALNPIWHSEHLAYTHVDGDSLGTMLPVPRTREALDLVVARVREIQARFPLPFLLENVVSLLPDAPGDFSEAAFFNHVSAQTGCGLLLDAYNLYCDEVNGRLDLDAFLGELDLSRIREIHLAGGTKYRGWQVDVHSKPVPGPALRIAADVLRRAPNVLVVTYELLEEAFDVMGTPAVVQEIAHLRSWLDAPPS
ncbi:MAG TPA: DUF692 family protein [Thermoleophilaceae bacterium]|nr:DUF692 family protein [Thermoleophilaceae bacterium]